MKKILFALLLLCIGCPQPEKKSPPPKQDTRLKEKTLNETQNMKDLFKENLQDEMDK